MTKEILRDKTLDWIEKLFNGPYFDRACWALMIAGVLYFGVGFAQIWAR